MKYRKKLVTHSQFVKRLIVLVALYFYVCAVLNDINPALEDIVEDCNYLNENPGVKHAKIALVTFYDNYSEDIREISLSNKEKYAKKHGYELFVGDKEVYNLRQGRPSAWTKFKLIEKTLPNFDYVVWFDADTVVVNDTIRIEDIIDDKHDLFYSKDENDINSGIFIIKNTSWARSYLMNAWDQDWLVQGDHPFKYEQRAIHYMHGVESMKEHAVTLGKPPYQDEERVKEKTKIVHFCALNSNVCEEFWYGLFLIRRTWCKNKYKRGHFVVHFAGKSPSFYRNHLIRKFGEIKP